MIDWDIDPFQRCGPLQFGSSRAEIGRQIGTPVRERRFSDSDHREYRGQGLRSYDLIAEYANDILISVTFPYQKNKLKISNVDILSQPYQAVADALKVLNGGRIEVYGDSYCFSSIGIVLNDWLETDVSDKWAWVASREGYSKFIGGQQPDDVLS